MDTSKVVEISVRQKSKLGINPFAEYRIYYLHGRAVAGGRDDTVAISDFSAEVRDIFFGVRCLGLDDSEIIPIFVKRVDYFALNFVGFCAVWVCYDKKSTIVHMLIIAKNGRFVNVALVFRYENAPSWALPVVGGLRGGGGGGSGGV